MKCDNLKAGVIKTPHDEGMNFNRGSDVIAVEERKTEFYLKSEVDEAMAKLKEEIKRIQEIANEQTFKLCVEKENVCQLEQLFQKQKDKADKLYHCLRCLVMRGLIKDCSEKESANEILKEFK